MKISTRRAAPIALAALALLLPACGGDDDDDAAATAEENDGEATAADDDGDDDEPKEVDLGDVPDECVDAIGDFLERIEPIVEDLDFENLDLDQLSEIGTQLEEEASDIGDDELEERCAQYTLADGEEVDALRQIAEDRAPGTLGYIDWIAGFQEEFADISIPDISMPDISIPDITMPDITLPDITMPDVSLAAGLPTTCEDAVAYMESMIAEHGTMGSLNASQIMEFSQVSSVISTDCSLDEMVEFYDRDDVKAFLS